MARKEEEAVDNFHSGANSSPRALVEVKKISELSSNGEAGTHIFCHSTAGVMIVFMTYKYICDAKWLS